MRLASHLALGSAAAAALVACTLLPVGLEPDAKSPVLAGYGVVDMAITTNSPAARERFEQGMAQAYAFNEAEAVRMFKSALALDPACAMCAWGVAYQLGPNINATERGDLNEALRYLDHALRHAGHASERERALIQAMALRYAHRSEARNTVMLTAPACISGKGGDDDEKPDPLDIAYAERMRELADRYPDDADIVSMYAEAEMIATKGDWWDVATGKPAGRMGEVADRLEAALTHHADHTGLNHYLIHATDALPAAHRAEASADRMSRLAPGSPHLLHMPSHTYVNLGRYADASRVNQQALAADESLAAELGKQGFSVSKDWRGHNSHFLWYAALMQGRGDLALETARASASRSKSDHELAEITRSRPLVTLLRLERWDAVLKEPVATGEKGMARLMWRQAQGVALARTGQVEAAGKLLAQIEPDALAMIKAHPSSKYFDKVPRGVSEVVLERLETEVALAQGQVDDALAHQAKSVAAGKDIDEFEPPLLAAGSRVVLGDMQMKAGRWAEAETSFRADLVDHPRSGWALRGLVQALQAQGRHEEVAGLREQLKTAWSNADAALIAMK